MLAGHDRRHLNLKGLECTASHTEAG